MTRDFTYGAYADLLDAGLAAGYEFLTVREYVRRESLPEQFVVLRHDVDRKPENALDFARIEHEHGVPATFYVRSIDKTFDPDLLREMESLGHEVGYHYEDLDRADGDPERARTLFDRNLQQFREYVDVDTVCSHGNPLTPYVNMDIWRSEPRFDEYDLLGEAYLSMDFDEVMYFSDTDRAWRVEDKHGHQVDTTPELATLLREQRVDRACLMSHPNRWADGYAELVAERTKDAATAAAKRGIELIR